MTAIRIIKRSDGRGTVLLRGDVGGGFQTTRLAKLLKPGTVNSVPTQQVGARQARPLAGFFFFFFPCRADV